MNPPVQAFVRSSFYGSPDLNSGFKSGWCTIATFSMSHHVQHLDAAQCYVAA